MQKLAGQTLWYGLPTIASRFLGYLMNLSLPLVFAQPATTADLTQLYALIPFLNIVFTYGLETAYFRFVQTIDSNRLYNTLSTSLFISTLAFSLLLWSVTEPLAALLGMPTHPEYLHWMIVILALDALVNVAFARLRQENQPRRYAAARLSGILVNVVVVIACLGILPQLFGIDTLSWLRPFFPREETGIRQCNHPADAFRTTQKGPTHNRCEHLETGDPIQRPFVDCWAGWNRQRHDESTHLSTCC